MIRRVTVSKQLVTGELYVGHSLVLPSSSCSFRREKKICKNLHLHGEEAFQHIGFHLAKTITASRLGLKEGKNTPK